MSDREAAQMEETDELCHDLAVCRKGLNGAENQITQLLEDKEELIGYLRHCVFLMDAMRPKGSVGDELATMREATALLARLQSKDTDQ